MDLLDQYFGIGPDLSHHSLSKNAVEGDLMTHNSASIDLVDDVNLSPDDNVEDNDEVYKNYVVEAGFIVRRGHECKAVGIIVNKEFVCSKEGIKRVELKEFDSLKPDCDDKKVKRKRYEFRTNCKARLYVIKYGDKYKVKTFVEDHNHGFFIAEDRYLQKSHSCTGSMKNLGYVKNTDKEWYGEFKVDYDEESHSVKCSCPHFERRGFLCRHAFYTLRANLIKKIPKQYLLRRWRKEAVVLPPLGSSYKASGSSGSSISKIYSKVNGIINQCGYDEEKLSKFLEQLSGYESELESSTVPQTSASTEQSLSSMIGIPVSPALKVFPPDTGQNKGGISGHRYKPSNNDVRIKAVKEDHDFRNCPNNLNRKKLNPKKVIKKTNRKQKTKKNESSKANSQQGADVFNFSSEKDSDC
ncbi:FAR1 DNA binding domain-containing protein [Artemisia annua]|uniref:FAR1 DNA binding domain-containing protein n=1 Tax=Artemisia annua TaxID=35608 RepID=A0A2U1MRN2_ARTAN|nr:FAR1 DNA binding domain-containing protein [Artemisia annua]